MEKYIVYIETKEGTKPLDITADDVLDMYNKVSAEKEFIRIVDYIEENGDT